MSGKLKSKRSFVLKTNKVKRKLLFIEELVKKIKSAIPKVINTIIIIVLFKNCWVSS